MTNPFYDYSKMILEKVSFDRLLFRREYRKALNFLSLDERKSLKLWLRQKNAI